MKKYLALTILMLSQFPLAFGQNDSIKTHHEFHYLNILANGYEGNIVLDVVDENDLPVSNYRSVITAGDDIIFDVPQIGPRATFFKDGSGLTVKIEKKGYKTYVSQPITTDSKMEMACVFKIILVKE